MKPNTERLQRLATHLRTGVLYRDIFDFSVYNTIRLDRHDGTPCGTAGCAIGECPMLFTEDMPDVKQIDMWASWEEILDQQSTWQGFFGISSAQYDHLFIPGGQNCLVYGGAYLTSQATRIEVAANIEAFIERAQTHD